MHSSGSMYSCSTRSYSGSSGVGWMQSTGQTSTQELSLVPMQGSAITYAIGMVLVGDGERVRILGSEPLQRPRSRSHVLRGGPDQPSLALLLEDMGAPARGPRAREQRREQLRRDLGVIEHHGRPELDFGREHLIGLARLEL